MVESEERWEVQVFVPKMEKGIVTLQAAPFLHAVFAGYL